MVRALPPAAIAAVLNFSSNDEIFNVTHKGFGSFATYPKQKALVMRSRTA
jgi:hypothetical protein